MKSIVSGWILCAYVLQASLASAAPLKEDMVLYHHKDRYSAFPQLYHEGDRLWVTFGWNSSRSHDDWGGSGKKFGKVWLYSPDGGKNWLEYQKDADYRGIPVASQNLTLSDGTQINFSARMHEVFPAEKKDELVRRGIKVQQWPDGRISASYRIRVTRKNPGDKEATTTFFEPPVANIGQLSSVGQCGLLLPGDVILGTVYGTNPLKQIETVKRDGSLRQEDAVKAGDPASRVWALRSEDKGKTWQLHVMAYDGIHDFDETGMLALPDGRILAMIRSSKWDGKRYAVDHGNLWQTESTDGGKTWSPIRKTDIWGFPATLIRLRNGDVLCSYGYRREPYGVRACLSHDGGRTWDVANEVVLRDDGFIGKGTYHEARPPDHGYPVSVELSDGTIFTVYYITLDDGVTHIAATRWSPELAKGKDASAAK